MVKKPIDIVLITWYRPELTKMVIEAIHQNTKRENFNLIVVDNNSPQEMKDMLQEYVDKDYIDNLIVNEFNKGLEPARNQGLADVESDLFICADNDCLPPRMVDGKDWVERMVELMDNNPEYAAISLRTQVMIGTGNPFDGHEQEEILDFPHPGGSYRIMRTDLVKKIGGWRDHMEGRGTEERYICGRLREMGYLTGFAVHIRTLHLFGKRGTFGDDRWGYPKEWKPEQTGHSDIWHPDLERGDDINDIKRYMDVVTDTHR